MPNGSFLNDEDPADEIDPTDRGPEDVGVGVVFTANQYRDYILGPVGSVYRTLHETQWKPGGEGEWVLLADLEPSHRRNLRAWMLRRAKALEFRYSLWEVHQIPDEIFTEFEITLTHRMRHPEEWLLTTPFMKELDRLIEIDNAARIYATMGPQY
jgi:hypothetical protein